MVCVYTGRILVVYSYPVIYGGRHRDIVYHLTSTKAGSLCRRGHCNTQVMTYGTSRVRGALHRALVRTDAKGKP